MRRTSLHRSRRAHSGGRRGSHEDRGRLDLDRGWWGSHEDRRRLGWDLGRQRHRQRHRPVHRNDARLRNEIARHLGQGDGEFRGGWLWLRLDRLDRRPLQPGVNRLARRLEVHEPKHLQRPLHRDVPINVVDRGVVRGKLVQSGDLARSQVVAGKNPLDGLHRPLVLAIGVVHDCNHLAELIRTLERCPLGAGGHFPRNCCAVVSHVRGLSEDWINPD